MIDRTSRQKPFILKPFYYLWNVLSSLEFQKNVAWNELESQSFSTDISFAKAEQKSIWSKTYAQGLAKEFVLTCL